MPFTRERVWDALWTLAPWAEPTTDQRHPASVTADVIALHIRREVPRTAPKFAAQPVTHNDLIAVRRVLGDLAVEGVALVIGKVRGGTGVRPTTYLGARARPGAEVAE